MNKKGDKRKMPPPEKLEVRGMETKRGDKRKRRIQGPTGGRQEEEVDTKTNKHGDKRGKSADKRQGQRHIKQEGRQKGDKEDKHKKGETGGK